MSSIQKLQTLTNAISALRPYRNPSAITSKSYFTYVNEPGMPIPKKEPCYVKTAEEALNAAGLASSEYSTMFFFLLSILVNKIKYYNYLNLHFFCHRCIVIFS